MIIFVQLVVSAMKNKAKACERKAEIVSFFYTIFGHRIREGMNPDEARREAYDAVTLRYEISSGRLLNIISEQKNSQKVNVSTLRQNAIQLIKELRAVNEGLDETKARNEKLVSLLQECLDDGS